MLLYLLQSKRMYRFDHYPVQIGEVALVRERGWICPVIGSNPISPHKLAN
jgi:hypothetical protein